MSSCETGTLSSRNSDGGYYDESKLELVKNRVLLDIRSRCDHGCNVEVSWSDVKLLWNLIYRHAYDLPPIDFSWEEKCMFLETVIYRGTCVPRYMESLERLLTEKYIDEAHAYGRFSSFDFDIFLADYVVYVCEVLFGMVSFDKKTEEWLCEPLKVEVEGEDREIPRYFLSVYYGNKELQESYDVSTWSGYMAILGFCIRWKSSLFSLGCISPGMKNFLDGPSRTAKVGDSIGLTMCMEAIYWSDERIRSRFDLTDPDQALGYLGWFIRYLESEINWCLRPEWVDDLLNMPSARFPDAASDGLTHLMEAVWCFDNEIRSIWDISNRDERRNYVQWFVGQHKDLMGGTVPEWVMDSLNTPIDAGLAYSDTDKSQISDVLANAEGLHGVNLVGWPRTEIGIGEDVRVAALALSSIDYPFIIQDAAQRIPPSPRQIDTGFEEYITEDPRFGVDIVFLDAATQYKYYSYDLFRNMQVGRIVVGVCPWELAVWPDSVAFSLDTLDYFWAATRFIYGAFEPYFETSRIALAPPAVVVPEDEIGDLVSFDGEGPFKFLTIFDGLSSIHRKNPMAVVEAFRLAFAGNNDVRLVVKMMNLREDNPDFERFMRMIGDDKRITVINKTMTHHELFELIRDVHCFVSLHRSEGFGRNIAESMILGRPVICSAYGGNVDFCFSDNSYLCEGKEIPVKPHEYAFSHGQKWFDASVEHAAALMKQVFDDPDEALVRARRAREYMMDFHSVKSAGNRYRELLARIGR